MPQPRHFINVTLKLTTVVLLLLLLLLLFSEYDKNKKHFFEEDSIKQNVFVFIFNLQETAKYNRWSYW